MTLSGLPERLAKRLGPIGIALEPLLEDRVRDLIAPVPFYALLPPQLKAESACRAWLEFLGKRVPDDEDWDRAVLLLLSTFTFVFDPGQIWNKAIERELARCQTKSGRPMGIRGTWFEARRRLAARLFHYGRRGTITPTKQAALRTCVSDFDFLLSTDAAAGSPHIRARYVGMRGTASLFLGRTSENRLDFYERAVADLEASGPLGDRSPQRVEYLIEAYLHRYDLTKDATILDAADAALGEAAGLGSATRGLSTLTGMTALARATVAIDANDGAAAEQFASVAAEHFQRALRQAPHQSFTTEYIRLNYGIALTRRAMSTEDAVLAEQLASDAIAELAYVQREAGPTYPNLWLPSAFALRADLRLRRAAYDTALVDAQEALARSKDDVAGAPELRARASASATTARLHLAIGRGVVDEVLEAFDWWSVWSDSTRWLPVPSLVAAIRFLANTPETTWTDRARQLVAMIRTKAAQDGMTPAFRRFALGHGGSVMLSVAKADRDLRSYREAYALYVEALDADDEPGAPELYGHAGEIALKLARAEVAAGKDDDAIALLQDATSFMRAAFERHDLGVSFSEKTPVVAVHSRAGEAYARLHAMTNDDADAAEAIRHLQSARALGNSTAALVGLLGDVYFRRGRAHRDLRDLRLAIALKTEARANAEAGDGLGWRENLSVTANAAMLIWSITGEASDLLTAAKAASDAAKEAPEWAWPILQLSEIAALPATDRRGARAFLVDEDNHALTRLALDGAATTLIERACQIAVTNRIGFQRDARFAGRQNVYTIADPHRLLNTTLIVKETPRENALREMQTITQFRDYLSTTAAPDWMKLPQPMSLIELGEHTAYVMRRAPGGELGVIALRRLNAGRSADDILVRSAQFLARYHAWRAIAPFTRKQNDLPFAVRKSLPAYAQYCGLSEAATRQMAGTFLDLANVEVPLVAKKDAHGENWLVTPQNEIVMLDLEAKQTTRLPLLYELAQLVEDHGLIETSARGWESRMRLSKMYLDELTALCGEPMFHDYGAIAQIYAAHALIRIFVLVPGTGRRPIRRRSESSVIRARIHRSDHYSGLAGLVRDVMAGTRLGETASVLVRQLADAQ